MSMFAILAMILIVYPVGRAEGVTNEVMVRTSIGGCESLFHIPSGSYYMRYAIAQTTPSRSRWSIYFIPIPLSGLSIVQVGEDGWGRCRIPANTSAYIPRVSTLNVASKGELFLTRPVTFRSEVEVVISNGPRYAANFIGFITLLDSSESEDPPTPSSSNGDEEHDGEKEDDFAVDAIVTIVLLSIILFLLCILSITVAWLGLVWRWSRLPRLPDRGVTSLE